MIAGHIKAWRTTSGLAPHPVWSEAFAWIERHGATAAEGDFPLEDSPGLVRVMQYPLKSREEARYEDHRHTIDLQYTIEGAEGIEVHPAGELTPSGAYEEGGDVQFFETPDAGSAHLINRAGHFCILFPGDAHQPQRQVEGFSQVRKLVVKIPLSALNSA